MRPYHRIAAVSRHPRHFVSALSLCVCAALGQGFAAEAVAAPQVAPIQYTIDAIAGSGGSISPSGSVAVSAGGSQTFTITADPNYHVTNVIVDGVSIGPANSYPFNNVTANHTISAAFTIDTYTVTTSAGPNGSITPGGTVVVDAGTSPEFTIAGDAHYHLANVILDGVAVGPVPSITLSSISTNHTISASFAIDTYTITATAGANGSITPDGPVSVDYGGSQNFVIGADPNYQIADVTVDGISVGAVGSYSFSNVTADHTIDATFAAVIVASSVVSIDDVHVTEGNSGSSLATFTVTVTPPSANPIHVNYATQSGTATATEDYLTASGTLDIPASTGSVPLAVTVKGDTKFESDETFTLRLTHALGATLSDSIGLGTIDNDDSKPVISIAGGSMLEGNSGSHTLNFAVTLSNPSANTIKVNVATKGITATTTDHDYTGVASTLTIAPGATSGMIGVSITGDTKVEPDETFQVILSAPTNAMLGTSTATGTILNDDTGAALPQLSISDVSLPEGNSGYKAFNFTVSLSVVSAAPVTVKFATAGITASASSGDYIGRNSWLTIPAGARSAVITVQVKGDKRVERNETFAVNLFSPTNATLKDAQGIGTILNDDGGSAIVTATPAGELSFVGAAEQEGETTDAAAGEPSLAFAANPVRGPLSAQFTLAEDAQVRITLMDAQGRLVDELANGRFGEGRHTLPTTARSAALAPGLYFVRMESKGRSITRKFVSLR